MRHNPFAAAFLALALTAGPALAQAPASAPAPTPNSQGGSTAVARNAKNTARTPRELTPGQMAGRQRQKACGAEWKDAKANGKTGGLKWPQYYSKCNARLKGNSA